MKETRFRIIELPTHQVLLQKDFDEEEDMESFIILFYHKGVTIKQTYGYESEEERDKYFSSITEEQAQSILDSILKMF